MRSDGAVRLRVFPGLFAGACSTPFSSTYLPLVSRTNSTQDSRPSLLMHFFSPRTSHAIFLSCISRYLLLRSLAPSPHLSHLINQKYQHIQNRFQPQPHHLIYHEAFHSTVLLVFPSSVNRAAAIPANPVCYRACAVIFHNPDQIDLCQDNCKISSEEASSFVLEESTPLSCREFVISSTDLFCTRALLQTE